MAMSGGGGGKGALSEINVTPLLDLAFVLLIIFIITTPLLEQSIPLKLPVGGAAGRGAEGDRGDLGGDGGGAVLVLGCRPR